MCNDKFMDLNNSELQEIDGGVAWPLIILGVGCVCAFAMGVYNGYKKNA